MQNSSAVKLINNSLGKFMAIFFKNANKGSIQLDICYGWDIDVKKWFIDVKMSGFTGGNLVQWFKSEKNYKKALENISI